MNAGQTIFSQLMEFAPRYEFRLCVERYHGDYKVQSFSCWDQFLTMAFAQLTYRESLRDIEACLRSTSTKLYHMGIRGQVSRNTLAHANQVRNGAFAYCEVTTPTAHRTLMNCHSIATADVGNRVEAALADWSPIC